MLTQEKIALPFDGRMEPGAFQLGIFPQVAGKQREETAAAVAIRRSQELDTDTAGQDDSLAKRLPSWRAHPRFKRASQISGGGSPKSLARPKSFVRMGFMSGILEQSARSKLHSAVLRRSK